MKSSSKIKITRVIGAMYQIPSSYSITVHVVLIFEIGTLKIDRHYFFSSLQVPTIRYVLIDF